MAYAGQFHRLVLLGEAYGDVWNTSLSIAHDSGGSVEAVTQGLIDAVATAVGTWYAGASTTNGLRAAASHSLVGLKLNRIGTDGRYVDGVTMEHEYSPAVTGGAGLSTIPQQATVISLLTDVSRGPAHRGRMYLPPVDGYVAVDQTTGQASVAHATRLSLAGVALVDALNDVYNAAFPIFSAMHVAIASNIGTGTFRRVTKVGAGRVPDVMRSRRSATIEDPIISPVPA